MENVKALVAALEGKKTYLIAGIGFFVTVFGYIFGPIQIDGNVILPHFSGFNVFQALFNFGPLATLRLAIQGIQNSLSESKS